MTRAPASIDDVIADLEEIVLDNEKAANPMGYFAALYNRVTEAVREAIAGGDFQDGPRMERLDVIFASRYLTAYHQYRGGQLPPRSWLQAFQAAHDPEHIVLQDLLIGMNAHINLDLGIAAARVAPGNDLPGLKTDFDRINVILSRLTPVVAGELDELSPVFEKLVEELPFHGRLVLGFSMRAARDLAWKFACELADLTPEEQLPLMAKRDDWVHALGLPILANYRIVRKIKARESGDVAANIRALAEGEFERIYR